mmetsp:Transcript_4497/g.10865  ORF Transcript_4497/g.10865 Transcript_4497/m.10865 type:complete len:120 (+) Transcript_4497:2113-2472(+)
MKMSCFELLAPSSLLACAQRFTIQCWIVLRSSRLEYIVDKEYLSDNSKVSFSYDGESCEVVIEIPGKKLQIATLRVYGTSIHCSTRFKIAYPFTKDVEICLLKVQDRLVLLGRGSIDNR